MTAAELLVPRFEVIEKYPGSGYTVGQILYNWLNTDFYIPNTPNRELLNGPTMEQLREYPNIFREMKWWEQRTKEQMPKAIISPFGEVSEIHYWNLAELTGISTYQNQDKYHSLILVDYLPYDICTHNHIERTDGLDKCLDCGVTNY